MRAIGTLEVASLRLIIEVTEHDCDSYNGRRSAFIVELSRIMSSYYGGLGFVRDELISEGRMILLSIVIAATMV